MTSAEILTVFNIIINAFTPALTVTFGVIIAASVLVWVIKRLS